jgi:hypothetical protein
MQKFVAVLFFAALSLQAESPTIKEQVRAASLFSDVRVGLKDGGIIQGRLMKSEGDELVVRVQENNTITDRILQLGQVTSFTANQHEESRPKQDSWYKRAAVKLGFVVAAPFVLVGAFFWLLFGGNLGA